MVTFSQFDASTGAFTGHIVRGFRPKDADGFEWIAGSFDHRSQRIDVSTGDIVAIEPPPVDDQARHRRSALALIAEAERKQLRVLREIALKRPGAIERLEAIDAQIAKLRAQL